MRKVKKYFISCVAVLGVMVVAWRGRTGEAKTISVSKLEQVIQENASYNAMIYDESEKLVEEIQTDGDILKYTYDDQGRISTISENENIVENITYGSNGFEIFVLLEDGTECYYSSSESITKSCSLKAASAKKYKKDTIKIGKKKYNMNCLISNKQFKNWKSLNRKKIQSFLEKKKSILAKPVKIYEYSMEQGWVKYIKTIEVSEYISRYCKKYKVNPKLVLSTIQKESGLVKEKSGLSYLDERFAQAMGCGVTDAGTFETFERFDVQIKNGIKILRHHYNNAPKKFPYCFKNINYGKKREDGLYNSYVWVDNRATYSLYKYTPHTLDVYLYEQSGTISGGNLLLLQVKNSLFKKW